MGHFADGKRRWGPASIFAISMRPQEVSRLRSVGMDRALSGDRGRSPSMKCQIQVRGEEGGTGEQWRPLRVPMPDGRVALAFASWDEAEDVLEWMQQSALLPACPSDMELRIVDLDDRPERRSAAGLHAPSLCA
jgi:hypothetical protein